MLPTIQIGPLALQTPGLMLLLALWLGISQAEKHAPVHKIKVDALYNLVFYSLIGGILGARLFYVLQYVDAFMTQPLDIFSLNTGLLDPFGGIATGLITALMVGRRQNMEFWPTLDALTPLLTLLAMGLACSHIASGEAFGMETSLPWPLSIPLWGAQRHPTQFYELVAALAIYGFLLLAFTRPHTPPGRLFLTFLALFAGSQLFIDGLRADGALLLGRLRTEQIVDWLALAISFWGLGWLRQPKSDQ